MAGMLPGVEAARRRRFHQKSNQCYGASGHGGTCSTRRPSFCLYVSSHDFQLCSSTSSTVQILINIYSYQMGSSWVFSFILNCGLKEIYIYIHIRGGTPTQGAMRASWVQRQGKLRRDWMRGSSKRSGDQKLPGPISSI